MRPVFRSGGIGVRERLTASLRTGEFEGPGTFSRLAAATMACSRPGR